MTTPAKPAADTTEITPGGLAPGQAVPAEKKLPAGLTKLLAAKKGPVVAGFILPGVNEDEQVRTWLESLRDDPAFADTGVLILPITAKTELGDLPELLDLTSTPTVAVFQRDGKISATWRGIVDKDMLAQSVMDARANLPHVLPLVPTKGGPYGNPAGIALGKKINAYYKKVDFVTLKTTGTDRLPENYLTGPVVADTQAIFKKGKFVKQYSKGTTADGAQIESLINNTGFFVKRDNMACWVHTEPPGIGDIVGQPMFPLQISHFGPPRRVKKTKGVIFMKVTDRLIGDVWILRIDAKTSALLAMRRDQVRNKIGESLAESTPQNPATPATPATPAAPGTTTTAPSTSKAPSTTKKSGTKKATPATPADPSTAWPKPDVLC